MITFALRAILIIASLATAFGILTKIRHSKVRIEDSLFWLFFALLCIVLAIWPGIANACAHAFGILSSQNFVFLLFIFILMLKVFSLSLQVSQLEGKVRRITQELAILKHDTMANAGTLGQKHLDAQPGSTQTGDVGSADAQPGDRQTGAAQATDMQPACAQPGDGQTISPAHED